MSACACDWNQDNGLHIYTWNSRMLSYNLSLAPSASFHPWKRINEWAGNWYPAWISDHHKNTLNYNIWRQGPKPRRRYGQNYTPPKVKTREQRQVLFHQGRCSLLPRGVWIVTRHPGLRTIQPVQEEFPLIYHRFGNNNLR